MTVTTIAELEALYDVAVPASLDKVVTRITPSYAAWIDAARFCILTTVGPEGTDGSPRGDTGPVVRRVDDRTLHLPDWRGNNRIDSLRNIVRDGRVSLMLMVPGNSNVIRINGTAVLSADEDVTQTFEQRGKHPKSVIIITVAEAYFQCAKAIMRSDLWTADPVTGLPTAGDMIKEQKAEFDGKSYDEGYAEYAKTRMW
ncbi:pyridoxamine 5'-phosphate oxidase family protein [Pseudooctadecabacter jejudonensis]|uniref:Pyridoxamine 5'-phosphate oxidase n=1 Tax=Pseudooctadecabacter jejudonensis TaxID=1391910 RepID=A0A1Y5T225_9RHOB|nr:pyridoxamine 5'-phosphate oxidase family protein [Pseudooctadecabacter jejudonensis]SLN54124.1 Pyridoxamine 5'-phosphate oxidase [Pseudooctadecabacter jejudonensis]